MTKKTITKINILDITWQDLVDGKYQELLPEIYNLAKIVENNSYHNKQTVFDHVMKVYENLLEFFEFTEVKVSEKKLLDKYLVKRIGGKTRKEILLIATLLHDFAKSETALDYPNGQIICFGHELLGAKRVKIFKTRFDLDDVEQTAIEDLVKYHGFISEVVNGIVMNGQREKYLKTFRSVVGDLALELVIFLQADILGSDLKLNDQAGFAKRLEILDWMKAEVMKE